MKRKKKKWTTKNTHLERKEKREDYDKDFAGWVAKVGIWMILIGAIIFRHCPPFCVNRKLQDSGFILESCFQI